MNELPIYSLWKMQFAKLAKFLKLDHSTFVSLFSFKQTKKKYFSMSVLKQSCYTENSQKALSA